MAEVCSSLVLVLLNMASSHDATINVAKIVNCIEDNSDLCMKLLNELTGKDKSYHGNLSIPWTVDNKYYSAVINISINSIKHFESDDCEAIIFLYSAYDEHSNEFSQIKDLWERVSDDISPTVCLLVEACLTDKDEDGLVLEWCVENGFELVVWNYKNEIVTAEDKQGIARISDALQAHLWPSMTMKDDKVDNAHGQPNPVQSPIARNEMNAEQVLSRGPSNHGDPVTDDDINNITGKESFEELFGRFSDMKVHAESLPHNERKEYAEKVVMAFWQAIGGDENEFNSDNET